MADDPARSDADRSAAAPPGGTEPADDERRLAGHAAALADAVDAAIGPWVLRSVRSRTDPAGVAWPTVEAAAAAAAARCRSEVSPRMRALLEEDVDAQATTPLSLLRSAVRYPTGVLADAGVPHVVRDEMAERSFPDDVYDLTPASFADVDPELHEPGLVWGAAKAHVHLARRRAEGKI